MSSATRGKKRKHPEVVVNYIDVPNPKRLWRAYLNFPEWSYDNTAECLEFVFKYGKSQCESMMKYENVDQHQFQDDDIGNFFMYLPAYFDKFSEPRRYEFFRLLFIFGIARTAPFYSSLVFWIRTDLIRRRFLQLVCDSPELRSHLNWHWLSNDSNLLKQALRSGSPSTVQSVYKYIHTDCKNLSTISGESLLNWTMQYLSVAELRDFVKNIDVADSELDVISVYPVLMKRYSCLRTALQIITRLYKKMLHYREVTVLRSVLGAGILLPELLRIVHRYVLPVLFWDANARNRIHFQTFKTQAEDEYAQLIFRR